MGRGPFGSTFGQFRLLFEGRSIAGVSEWHLLHRYLDRRDEVAFGAIVARHGPMVLGVCRRVLVDPRDVEDAFQATFVILARKGATLGEDDPVAHWLYGVARRVAMKARASAARRRRLESSASPAEVAPVDDPIVGDLARVIDEELARLPSKYRAPVVLCYLEGLTHEEAARQLGWPLGSVKGRLSRARDLLKGRLSRRGLAPGGLVALARGSRPPVSPSLLELTMRASMASRAAGVVPASVSALAAGSLSTMMLNKLKVAGVAVLVLGTGAAVMAYQMGSGEATSAQVKSRNQASKSQSLSTPTADVADWTAGWPDLTQPPADDPVTISLAIRKALDEPVAMNFPSDTPLEDVKKYIQEATKGPGLPNGIPIYVDPQALQDSDKTMASTVVISLEGIPLKTTLRLLLKQLDLRYEVKDGLVTIGSVHADEQATPFSIMEEKAQRGELTRQQYQQLIEALKLRAEVAKLAAGSRSGLE